MAFSSRLVFGAFSFFFDNRVSLKEPARFAAYFIS